MNDRVGMQETMVNSVWYLVFHSSGNTQNLDPVLPSSASRRASDLTHAAKKTVAAAGTAKRRPFCKMPANCADFIHQSFRVLSRSTGKIPFS